MTIGDIEEPPVHVDEESMAAADLVRFPGQEVLVGFRVSCDATQTGHVEPETLLAGRRNILVFRRYYSLGTRSRKLNQVLSKNPTLEQALAFFARLEIFTI